MADPVLDTVRCILVAMPAGWLTLGVLDNILYPAINRDDVGRVLRMESLKDYPQVAALVGHRRIDNDRAVFVLFRLIVASEVVAALLLWIAVAALAGSLLGLCAQGPAVALGVLGLLAFTGVWAAFLVGGQWFYYWYGSHGQQTHLLATLWGIATMAVLIA